MAAQPQEKSEPTFGMHLGAIYVGSYTLSVIMTPLLCVRFGRRALGREAFYAMLVILAFIAMYPQHAEELTAFLYLWLAAVFAQKLMANWCHKRGIRQLTNYVGKGIVCCILPINEHLCRKVINPALTFWIGCQQSNPALALMLKCSAFGQVAMCSLIALSTQKHDDERGDIEILMAQQQAKMRGR